MPQQFRSFFRCRYEPIFITVMLTLYGCYICLLFVVDFSAVSSDLQDLKLLQVITRHGAKTPDFLYPKDPNSHYKFKEGMGQLTNLGKLQQYRLGQFLRERYHTFFTSNPKEVYARSSAVDRTMESAMATLAGLYPPEDTWIWNNNLMWQPIPVHTTPGKDDYLLYYFPPCPAFIKELSRLMKTQPMQDFYSKYKNFFEFLGDKTGMNITNWHLVMMVHSILEIEKQNGLAMPSWATEKVFEEMRIISDLTFRFLYDSILLQRLRSGPLIQDLIQNMNNKLNGSQNNSMDDRKLFLYSTHDAVVAALMNALKVYNDVAPPFAATLIFELHSDGSKDFLRLFYGNSSNPENGQELHSLQIPGCSSDCPLEDFINLTKDFVPIDPKKECFNITA